MVTIPISGVNVDFPFEPYHCQIDYMEKVLQSLMSSSNALLESPTGTGKTLCLLCSTLAWQLRTRPPPPPSMTLQYGDGPSIPNISKQQSFGPPVQHSVIIYASRTHSQLSQVISELKSTSYRPTMAVLGSREQLCIHEKASVLRGSALNHACNTMSTQRRCMYKNNLDNYQGMAGIGNAKSPILDIEQLVQEVGHRDHVCPYFYSRESSTNAELVLLPYNYLLEASIRASLKIEWKNAVVIFDEAHNLERVAADAASISMSSADIAQCIAELQQVLTVLKMQESNPVPSSSQPVVLGGGGSASSDTNNANKPTISHTARILRSLFDTERRLDEVPLSNTKIGNSPSCALPGAWLPAMLEASGFFPQEVFQHIEEVRRCAELLMDEAENAMQGSSLLTPAEPKLVLLGKLLSRAFRGRSSQECAALATDYKVFICEDNLVTATTNGVTSRQIAGKKKRVLNYWCFSPGVAMEDLKRLGVRSFIVTSGTLSPMDSFREDLKLPFPVVLENPHVIGDNQIWVGAIQVGPNGKSLNSSFNNRENEDYKDELGISILRVCTTMAGHGGANTVPRGPELRGGVLTFFPSYGAMDAAVQRWTNTGLLAKLREAAGAVVVEPKSSASGPSTQRWDRRGRDSSGRNNHADLGQGQGRHVQSAFEFGSKTSSGKTKSLDAGDGGDSGLGGVVAEFEQAIRDRGCCLLLAVCRGKVSEGIDFKDAKGRVAIITGIPFAPPTDPWITLKKEYLDERCARNKVTAQTSIAAVSTTVSIGGLQKSSFVQASSLKNEFGSTVLNQQGILTGSSQKLASLSGQSWYVQTASRAVNQALGRVIRHRTDWGAVFLLDDRFLSNNQRNQLSGWVRPRVKPYTVYNGALADFRKFITSAMTDPKLAVKSDSAVVVQRISREVPMSLRLSTGSEKEGGVGDFMRRIQLSASVVEKGVDLNESQNGLVFIDPALLQTQEDFPTRNSVVGKPAQMGFEMSALGNRQSEYEDTPSSSNFNLADVINKLKKDATGTTGLGRGLAGKKGDENVRPASLLEVIDQNSQRSLMTKADGTKSVSNTFALPQGNIFTQKRLLNQNTSVSASATSVATKASSSSSGVGAQVVRKVGLGENDSLTGDIGECSWSSNPSASSQKNTMRGFSFISSSSATSSNSGRVNKADEPSPSQNRTQNEFRSFLEDLSRRLPSSSFSGLKTELRRIKSEGGVKEVSQVRRMVDATLPHLRALGPDSGVGGAEAAALRLTGLIPNRFSDLFSGLVRKTCQTMRVTGFWKANDVAPSSNSVTTDDNCKKRVRDVSIGCEVSSKSSTMGVLYPPAKKEVIQVEKSTSSPHRARSALGPLGSQRDNQRGHAHQASKEEEQYSVLDIETDLDPSRDTLTQQTSKRARLLQSQATTKSVTADLKADMRSDPRTVLARLLSIELSDKGLSSKSNLNTKASNTVVNVTCPICREKVSEEPYYAARGCGHICCKSCWSGWFKVKKACPICRVPTTAADVTGVTLK